MNEKIALAKKEAEKIVNTKKGENYVVSDAYLRKCRDDLLRAMEDPDLKKKKDRFIVTVLQISCKADMQCEFLYDLIEKFEENIPTAYAFMNALHR